VNRLEKQGLIERRPDARNKRVSQIHPSSGVYEFVRKKIPALRRGPLREALKRASNKEQRKIGWALRRLRELLECV
jgi:DNA-binding MarR family transcriptional regulator